MKAIIISILFMTFSLSLQAEEKYPVDNVYDKVTDNRGDGFDDLYGTRNLRLVLKNLNYRGGANNRYHRENRRNNVNPLPNDGLQNLCEEGFSRAVYLYRENFDTAPKEVRCRTRVENRENVLTYTQRSPFYLDEAVDIIEYIYSAIQEGSGPIYSHCWNGWHASGLIAAYTLIQFCDWENEDAVAYWDRNTDGNNRDSKYESIRRRIRNFEKFNKYEITAAQKAKYCVGANLL